MDEREQEELTGEVVEEVLGGNEAHKQGRGCDMTTKELAEDCREENLDNPSDICLVEVRPFSNYKLALV